MSVIEIVQKLIACPSVTPKDEGAQEYLAALLEDMGFEVHHLPFGEGEERVPNLFARIGAKGPHLCFAGHTDVVPPGPEEEWTYGPFNPKIQDGVLYGRGASDMKGSVAAFIAGIQDYFEELKEVKHQSFEGSISLLITGDEEGPAIHGTVKVLEWMKENGHVPDVCLVGEPTNPDTMGQEVKIGRRGSLTGTITVSGTQGHVAYQHLADNPLPRLVEMLDALSQETFDEGSEFFPPTNLEITTIDVGNTASNVIPAGGSATFNIRFSDQWSGKTLSARIREILDSCGHDYDLSLREGAESFLTQPGDWTQTVSEAIKDALDQDDDISLTTNGGTSDARFVHHYCPVVEFGGINATIHQINENAKVSDLEDLKKIYTRILEKYFAA